MPRPPKATCSTHVARVCTRACSHSHTCSHACINTHAYAHTHAYTRTCLAARRACAAAQQRVCMHSTAAGPWVARCAHSMLPACPGCSRSLGTCGLSCCSAACSPASSCGGSSQPWRMTRPMKWALLRTRGARTAASPRGAGSGAPCVACPTCSTTAGVRGRGALCGPGCRVLRGVRTQRARGALRNVDAAPNLAAPCLHSPFHHQLVQTVRACSLCFLLLRSVVHHPEPLPGATQPAEQAVPHVSYEYSRRAVSSCWLNALHNAAHHSRRPLEACGALIVACNRAHLLSC